MSVVVLGPAVLDRFYRVTRLPETDESVLVTARCLDAGGKGLNQAVAAARAGAPTRLCTAVAGDRAGRFLARVIAREGLDSPLVSRRPGRSDESVIWVDPAGRHAIASHVAPEGWVPADLEARLGDSLGAGDRLLVAGFLAAARLVPLAARLAARGVRLQLNLAPFACDYGALWPHLALVVANAGEMRLHTGRPPDEAARLLRARGVDAVVVTRGAEGASWYDAGQTIHVPAPSVPVVDTTAAGDVLAGVLAAALDRGLAPDVALDRAVRAASLAVTRLGSRRAIPTRRQLALR